MKIPGTGAFYDTPTARLLSPRLKREDAGQPGVMAGSHRTHDYAAFASLPMFAEILLTARYSSSRRGSRLSGVMAIGIGPG